MYKDGDEQTAQVQIVTQDHLRSQISSLAGVYGVICKPEKYAYIGQSINILNRLRGHKLFMISKNPVDKEPYITMRKHVQIHGIEAFEFIKIKVFTEDNKSSLRFRDELRKAEAEVMIEYFDKGYILYNTDLPSEIIANSVLCHSDFVPIIKSVIEALTNKRIEPAAIQSLIQGFQA